MRTLSCIAALLILAGLAAGFLGLMYFIATVGNIAANKLTATLLFGAAGGCLVFGAILAYLAQRAPTPVVVKTEVELPSHIDLSQLTCKYCGGALSRESLTLDRQTGSITITCPYCHRTYQLVEEVKW